MNRNNILMSTSVLLLVVSTSLLTTNVFADAPKQEAPINAKKDNNDTIIDPADIYSNLLNAVGKSKETEQGMPYQGYGVFSYGDISTYSNFMAIQDGDLIVNNETLLYAGESVLTNNTDTEQTLKTNPFSKTTTNTVTSQVTHGFMLGAEATATFGIPLVGSTEITLKAEYNYSNASGVENSESYTYGVEPQEVKVPPHSSVKVRVDLNTADISGKVKLEATPQSEEAKGVFDYGSDKDHITSEVLYSYNWETLTKDVKDLGLEVPYVDYDVHDKTPKLVGSGVFEAKYGTTFKVTVSPYGESSNRNTQSVKEVPKSYFVSPNYVIKTK